MSEVTSSGERGHEVPLRTIMLLGTAAFASSVNIRATDPLLPQIAEGFGITVGTAAQIITVFTIGYGLTQLLFGPAGDRFGKYLVVAITTMLAGVASAGAALAPSFELLTVARFAVGGFAAAAIPLAFAWIGDAIAFERRQAVLARFLSAQMSGIILGQAAGGIIGDMFGWRSVFLIVGSIHMLAGLAMLTELKLNPRAQPPMAGTSLGLTSVIGSVVSIVRRPWSRVLLIAVFCEALAMYGAFAYIGADLRQRFGLSYTLVGAVMAVYGAGAILYSMTAKRLIAKLGEAGLVIGGGVLMAMAFAGLAFAPRVEAVPPLMVLLGLAFYMMHNTLQNNATQMAPEARGLGVSIFALALFFGQSIGVAAAAPIMDLFGAPPIFLAASCALPLVALWFRARLGMRPG